MPKFCRASSCFVEASGMLHQHVQHLHQHVQHHVLRHAHGEIGIDDAHDRHVGQIRIRDDVIDAGAERKDRLQTRQAGEQPARRVPGAGIGDVGGIAEALRPQADVALRRQRAHALFPRLRIKPGDSEEDRGHENSLRLCSTSWIVIAGHSASKTRVNALTTRQSIPFAKKAFFEEGWTPGSSPGVTRVDMQRLNQFTRTMPCEVAPARGLSRSLAYGLPHSP
jgi:hypothetical protein